MFLERRQIKENPHEDEVSNRSTLPLPLLLTNQSSGDIVGAMREGKGVGMRRIKRI